MDLNKSMKYSLIFGLAGAFTLPFIYEMYANISSALALGLLGLGVIYAGVKFSRMKFKEAAVGITCTIAYSGILGGVWYMIVHPKIQESLIKRSVYFQLTVKEQLYFLLYSFLILLGMFAVCGLCLGIKGTAAKLKSNGEKAGEYIDNAFDDEEEE